MPERRLQTIIALVLAGYCVSALEVSAEESLDQIEPVAFEHEGSAGPIDPELVEDVPEIPDTSSPESLTADPAPTPAEVSEKSGTPATQETVIPEEEDHADLSGEPVEEPQQDFFKEMLLAVVGADVAGLETLFEQGASPDQEIPVPAPEWLRETYKETPMAYYLENEPGLTLLMLASYEGRPEVVQAFVDAGAEIFRKTRKHKSFALQFAAKSQSVEAIQRLLKVGPDSETARLEIKIDLGAQRGSLWREKECIGVTRISTGREGYETDTGRFVVTNKYRHWTSTIYNARMPYFMRLSCGDFGLHAGEVPGYPASHGCIRLPEMDAKDFFKRVPIGTLVTIY